MTQQRWTVRTEKGAFIVYATTARWAWSKTASKGHKVTEVWTRGRLDSTGRKLPNERIL